MHPARRRLTFLSAALAALAAILALVLPAATASASAVPAAGNRVGASPAEMILAVGASHTVSPAQGRCGAALQGRFAAGACVAAEDAAPELPAYAGGKTSGVLVRADGSQVHLESGYDGPALDLPKPRPGMNGNIVSHVEAHAAAIMRSEGLDDATLYINRMPCGGANGCMLNVSRMVPSGSTLNIYVMPEGSAGTFEDWINVMGTG